MAPGLVKNRTAKVRKEQERGIIVTSFYDTFTLIHRMRNFTDVATIGTQPFLFYPVFDG